jgi:hypothetical protein
VRRAGALPLALGIILLIVPAADALDLRATAGEPGRIALRIDAAPGVPLTVRDDLTGAQRALTPTRERTLLRRFAVWSCDASARGFTAVQGAETATAAVRTPSCAHRVRMTARRGVARLFDRWRLGVRVRFCVRPPGARERCRTVDVGRETTVRFRSARPGAYLLRAVTPQQRLRRKLIARPPGGRLRILATGDSMIQIVDSFMRERARPARLRSDARVATGISKPSLLDWRAHAREQVASIQPDVTVMFLGANDGFPMAGADCCGIAWIAEYARRARAMMRTYARGGRARVYWLLLPAARGGLFRETFPAVNAALRRAAAGLQDDVRLVDLEQVFTPGGRFRRSMRIHGRRVRVRQSDGVHLNATGAELAARLVVQAIRRDRMLP